MDTADDVGVAADVDAAGPGGPTLPPVAVVHTLLTEQWDELHRWIAGLTPADLAEPSVLDGWTVGVLVTHLGRAMDGMAALTPDPGDSPPTPIGTFIGGYGASAADISRTTLELADRLAGDLAGSVDRMARRALDHLASFLPDDRTMLSRRGPVTLRDYAVTRAYELVVHADDLSRSLPDRAPVPLVPDALALTSRSLLEILRHASGDPWEVLDERAWLRLAAGRVPVDAGTTGRALRVADAAAAVERLRPHLPLL